MVGLITPRKRGLRDAWDLTHNESDYVCAILFGNSSRRVLTAPKSPHRIAVTQGPGRHVNRECHHNGHSKVNVLKQRVQFHKHTARVFLSIGYQIRPSCVNLSHFRMPLGLAAVGPSPLRLRGPGQSNLGVHEAPVPPAEMPEVIAAGYCRPAQVLSRPQHPAPPRSYPTLGVSGGICPASRGCAYVFVEPRSGCWLRAWS